MKPLFLAAALSVVPPGLAAAQGLQNPDPAFRSTVDPRVPAAGGGSEQPLTPSPDGKRVVQQNVGRGAGSSESMPSNRGTPEAVGNGVPRAPVSNEGNPR